MLFLTEVDSTNTYAINLLRNVNVMEGTVVHTDNQTQGKGQRGANWLAAKAANITASVILKPTFLSIEKSFYLSKISALAIHDVLAEILSNSQYDIKIKWPNDILVNHKKIAGILIENQFNKTLIANSVIGIGLNINQFNFGEFDEIATSLKKLTNIEFDRVEILKKMASYLEKWYLMLKTGKYEEIDLVYLKNLFAYKTEILFKNEVTSEDFRGTIVGVNELGKLMIKDSLGNELLFEVKEIKPYL